MDSIAAPDWLNVSRETIGQFVRFVALVEKWTPAINLVSRRSIADIWDRHIFDSAQLFALVPGDATRLVDLGSGGGFPGVVLAIMARDTRSDLTVTLVEADRRKATFLSECIRQLSLPATVVSERIELLPSTEADVLTMRALAPLATLCGHVQRHLAPHGVALIPKGAEWEVEVHDARRNWSFTWDAVPSKSDPAASVLALKNVDHV